MQIVIEEIILATGFCPYELGISSQTNEAHDG